MRVKYLNYAKAIGIFLVIIEHVIASYTFMQPATICILAFHMPLFFVISGYQYSLKEKVDGISLKFVYKRAKRILIPYAIFVVCILLYKIPSTLITENQIDFAFLKYMSENIFVTGYGVGWFLIALFYSELIFKAIFCTENKVIHMYAVIASCVLGILFSFGSNIFLKLIARVFIACTFLWIGYYAGKFKLLSKLPCYVFCGIFALSAVLSQLNGQCSMLGVSLGVSRLLFLYNAIAMSLSFIGIVKQLETKELPYLKTIGFNTLIIMLTHTYIIVVIKRISYLFLPCNFTGDIVSIIFQVLGAFTTEILLVLIIVKIKRKRHQSRLEMT